MLVGIILIIALFVKKDFAAKHEVTINTTSHEVFDYIRYLKNQDHYSVWAKMDPGMKRVYRGTAGTVGFVSAWDGNGEVGNGSKKLQRSRKAGGWILNCILSNHLYQPLLHI